MVEHTFAVSGIHCEGCESAIETGLRRLDGVRRVRADRQAQTISVRYDEARLDDAELARHLARMGYEPVAS